MLREVTGKERESTRKRAGLTHQHHSQQLLWWLPGPGRLRRSRRHWRARRRDCLRRAAARRRPRSCRGIARAARDDSQTSDDASATGRRFANDTTDLMRGSAPKATLLWRLGRGGGGGGALRRRSPEARGGSCRARDDRRGGGRRRLFRVGKAGAQPRRPAEVCRAQRDGNQADDAVLGTA